MNLAAIALSAALATPFAPPRAQACDYISFMVDSSGRCIDLSAMTRGGENSFVVVRRNAPPVRPNANPQELTRMGTFKWADAYCQARGRGQIGSDATESANSAVSDWVTSTVMNLYGFAATEKFLNQDSGYLRALVDGPDKARELCPELQPSGSYD